MSRLKKSVNYVKRTRVTCIQCWNCEAIIYSRARHDYRPCPCGTVAIDGGFDYVKMCFNEKVPKMFVRYVRASREELYEDWNNCSDKFGVIANAKR